MKEYHLIDKSLWGEGKWQKEPDLVTWVDTVTMYPCVARRNLQGAWEGYVAVDETHPCYLVSAAADVYEFFEVHGGIVYTGLSSLESQHFSPPKRYWWIGFDCMHAYDLIPPQRGPKFRRSRKNVLYRDLEFVKQELTELAHQLANMDDRLSDIMIGREHDNSSNESTKEE